MKISRTRFLLAWLTVLATIDTGHSQTNAVAHVPISVRAAIEAALLYNRALQIERINPELARSELSAAYGAYDPLLTAQGRREHVSDSGAFDPANPAVDKGFDTESDIAGFGLSGLLPSGLIYNFNGNYGYSTGSRDFLNFDAYRVAGGIYLQQPLLKNFWIDLPRLTIRVSKRNLKISEEGVRFVAMDTLNLVQQGYADLIQAWDSLQVQRDLLATREQFLANIRRQVEVGTLTVLEERVAASQLSKVEADLITASNAVALAGNNLRTLMGVGGADWDQQFLTPTERLEPALEGFDLKSSWARGLAQRPDLIQLAAGLENAESNLKFRRNQLFPGLDIVGSYGRRGASSRQAFPPDQPSASLTEAFDELARGDAPSDMIGLVFSVPLSRTADRAQYRAGKQLKKQAELLMQQKKELVLREISDAMHSAKFSFDRVHSTRRATEQARAALKAEEEKLAGGRSSINFVLQFQADLAAARSAEVQAHGDFHKAISQLHFAEGSILERNKIDLEFR